jgi:hypothetical protein
MKQPFENNIKSIIDLYKFNLKQIIYKKEISHLGFFYVIDNFGIIYDDYQNRYFFFNFATNSFTEKVNFQVVNNPNSLNRDFYYYAIHNQTNSEIIKSDTKEIFFKTKKVDKIFACGNLFAVHYLNFNNENILGIIDSKNNTFIKHIKVNFPIKDYCLLQGFANQTVWFTTKNTIIRFNIQNQKFFVLKLSNFALLKSCDFNGRGYYVNNLLYLLDNNSKKIYIFNC